MLCLSNKLKKIIILTFILLITGCKATYNLDIELDSINEELVVIESDSTKFLEVDENLYNTSRKDYLDTNLKWPTPAYKDIEINPYEPIKVSDGNYYSKEDISNSSKLGIKLNYKFITGKYEDSNILNKCYKFSLDTNNNIISFKTTDKFECFNEYPLLDEAEINIKTSCNMISNNSDSNNDKTYTWKITKDNYENKTIEFKLKCVKEEQQQEKADSEYEVSIIICSLLYLGVIIVIIGFFKLIFNKKNKI